MQRHRTLPTLALLGLLLAFSQCQSSTEGPAITPGVSWELAQDRATRVSEVAYTLRLDIPDQVSDSIPSTLSLAFRLTGAKANLQLDFAAPTKHLQGLTVNGQVCAIDHRQEHLILPAAALQEGKNTVDIQFIAGDGSLNRNEAYLYTLLVPDRARTVFPCFDQPNLKATYTLTLTTPPTWEALANAPLAEKNTLASGGLEYRFKTSDLISTYLFSFVAGEFAVEERSQNGRTMRMLHRESDAEKVTANVEALFDEHFRALAWLEEYTGIPYPFQKFDFAIIPSFQYGGMEHVGAIQYSSNSLMLDPSATINQRLRRTRLIAHETAHMWFGDLVTMEWFNDVWMKEVFANFMAGKVARELYPEVDHDLNFLVSHHPAAYSVDRTAGANPIRQPLDNLNLAGTLYGAIIYNKAPIVLRQLEYQMGEAAFRLGVQEYLRTYAHGNATWNDLLPLLEAQSDVFAEGELQAWSDVWVASPGRPELALEAGLVQADPMGQGRVWPMQFHKGFGEARALLFMREATLALENPVGWYNTQGLGYGLFPVPPSALENDLSLPTEALSRASLHITLYENMLADRGVAPGTLLEQGLAAAPQEDNPLVLDRLMGYISSLYWSFLRPDQRAQYQSQIESTLWTLLTEKAESRNQDLLYSIYGTYASIAQSPMALDRLYQLWEGDLTLPKLTLSERDFTSLALGLMIKQPEQYETLLEVQAERIADDERKARFEYVAVAAHPDVAVRDSLFATWELTQNRAKEPWVLAAANLLHHPLRQQESIRYLPQALAWLAEIQQTGDIFFPKRWLDTHFGDHQSPEAVQVVVDFLDQNPDYQPNLKAKILQAYDQAKRAAAITQPKATL